MVGQARIQFASHRVSSDRESMASAYWEPMQPTSRHAEIDADDPLVVAIGALVRIEDVAVNGTGGCALGCGQGGEK